MRKYVKRHIEKVGQKRFNAALDLAMYSLKQDARLTGLDKTRKALAQEVAMRATGHAMQPVYLPPECGRPAQEFFTLCEDAVQTAVRYVEGAAAKV